MILYDSFYIFWDLSCTMYLYNCRLMGWLLCKLFPQFEVSNFCLKLVWYMFSGPNKIFVHQREPKSSHHLIVPSLALGSEPQISLSLGHHHQTRCQCHSPHQPFLCQFQGSIVQTPLCEGTVSLGFYFSWVQHQVHPTIDIGWHDVRIFFDCCKYLLLLFVHNIGN